MSKEVVRTAFAYCFLGLLALLGVSAVFAYLAGERPVSPDIERPTANVPVVKSYRPLYPFEGEPGIGKDEPPRSPKPVVRSRMPKAFSAYRDRICGMVCAVGRNASGKYPLSDFFRRVAGRYDKIVENCVVRSGSEPIIRLDNGSYTYIFPYSDSAGSWTNIQAFASWLKDRGIQCLHLLPPYKFDDSMTTFPAGIPHGYARMVAEYRRFMAERKIPCLDAKEPLLAENPDFYSWFGKLYLHYTAHAGLTIAQAAARNLRELGVDADVETLKGENFTRCVYPGLFRANYAMESDPDSEDVEVYYPHADGRFRVEVPSMGLDWTGGFHDTIIAQPYLKSPSGYCYAAFLYGYLPLIRVENLTCTNHTRVLVIRRCDAGVVYPYLACAVRYVDIVSPGHFDGSIRTFIERTKPDVVMFCTYMQTHAGDRFWELK